MAKVIALDFDGVIHSHTSPWIRADLIPDPPVPGAIEFIKKALEAKFKIAIFSCRSSADINGVDIATKANENMQKYLLKHGLTAVEVAKIKIHSTKPAASVYIDDRGWRFEGSFPTLEMIDAFKPWNKR